MARVPLLGGAYEAQSIIANAQRCVNLYPEKNPDDAPTPFTYYPTPGLVRRAAPTVPAPGRGLLAANNGKLYAVIGSSVYYVDPQWALHLLGAITAGPTTPVSMVDNGTVAVIVDGSALGWQITLSNDDFAQIVDPTGAFVGSTRVDYLDTFLLFNQPGTLNWYSTHSNVLVFDPLYVAPKTDWPDPLVVLAVVHREIWLLGKKKSEIWYNAGNPTFPFSEFPGAYVEFGCAAPYSVATTDVSIYWLSQSLQGQGIVLRGTGYKAQRVSTHAIETALSTYPRIDDAEAFIYQQRGHVFYQITFPSAGVTWVYDEAAEAWHQRAWLNPANGKLERHRARVAAFAYGKNVVLDYATGALYTYEPDTFTDSAFPNLYPDGEPIQRIRSWPHLSVAQGAAKVGYNELDSNNRISFKSFDLDIAPGEGGVATQDLSVSLRWSDNRGKSYGNPVLQEFARQGEFLTSIQWQRLGIARDRVWEVSWTCPVKTALQGAWIELQGLRT